MGQISIKAIKNITIERGLIGDTDFKNLKFCFAINTGRKKGALILGEKSIEELLEWIKMFVIHSYYILYLKKRKNN